MVQRAKWELDYWDSGEWQVVEERLDDMDKKGILYCPGKDKLFAVLDLLPMDSVRCVILGQDPYPDPKFATGIAFSIPKEQKEFPPTLANIVSEYSKDLHYPYPTTGDLTPWVKQGVLLWNVIPSCGVGRSMSHDWPEWAYLTQEIISKLAERDVVFAALGQVAQRYTKELDALEFSHPSPRGNYSSIHPFLGSRLFSTINGKLKGNPIDWRLT
jgi:uracil-DNA glycosylase